jgi:uncharacterized protein
MLTKHLPAEFKVDSDKWTFEGYASTWDIDLVGDQIIKGAFKKTLEESKDNRGIKVLWEHKDPFGMPSHMEEDSKGLYVKAKVSETAENKSRLTYMKDGIVDKMSIGYDVLQDDISEDGSIRMLKELKLYEFSAVTFPANPFTSIENVKSHVDILSTQFGNPNLSRLLKEGRPLSKANIDRLKNAIGSLQEILNIAEGNLEKNIEPGIHSTEPNAHSYEELSKIFEEMKSYAQRRK